MLKLALMGKARRGGAANPVEQWSIVRQGMLVAMEKSNLLVPVPGSPQALLQALRDMPKLEPGDVDALEEEIRQSRLPVRDEEIFG